jgi:hypothetical protein
VITPLHTLAILLFVAVLKFSTVHDIAAAFPSFSYTYWGFIFSAYVRKGDEGYGQIESCGEVEEDPLPHRIVVIAVTIRSYHWFG